MIGAALTTLVPAAFNLITGAIQKSRGQKQLDGLERPQYEIPKELQTALALSKANYADPRFTGQTQVENRIGQTMANAAMSAMEFGNPMDAIAGIQGESNRAYQGVAEEQARQQRDDLSNLQNMSQVMSQAKDTQWQMNKFAPYSEKYNEARERIGAGQTNIATGLQGLANVGTGLLSTMGGPKQSLGSQVDVGKLAQDSVKTAADRSQIGNIMDTVVKMYMYQIGQAKNYLGSGVPNFKD